MNTFFKYLYPGIIYFSFIQVLDAQCVFNPTVSGDTLTCGEEPALLSTQQYDAYQWYFRLFGSNDPAEPISGATGQHLEMDPALLPAYVFVEATQNGCTERSPEILVDLYAFLPVSVLIQGDYHFTPTGNIGLCPEDTIFLILNEPYEVNIQWFRNNEALSGQQDDTLVVVEPGFYLVEAAPAECPSFIETLDGPIRIVEDFGPECISSTDAPGLSEALSVLYTPGSDHITVQSPNNDLLSVRLWQIDGALVADLNFRSEVLIRADQLPTGLYVLQCFDGRSLASWKLMLGRH